MPHYSDTDLFKLRHTEYRHVVSDGKAAALIAERLKFDPNSVRGRLSRADTAGNRIWLAEFIATNPPTKSPSVERQKGIFNLAERELNQVRRRVNSRGGQVIGLYDIHYPYTRFDAFDLALQITSAVQPDYLVYGGDLNDHEGFGQWSDDRSPYDRLFSADYANNRLGEYSLTSAVSKVSPHSLSLYLTGNHDLWRFSYLRSQDPQQAEERIADYVEDLAYRRGIYMFSTTREEKIDLHHGLDTWHGQFTSPNHQQNAKSTIGQFMDNGRAKSIVVGHTHRPAHVSGSQVGYSGVDYWNAPCLSRVERIPWLKRDPRAWGMGIFYAELTDEGVRGENILFTPTKNSLVAYFNGRRYETELKDSK